MISSINIICITIILHFSFVKEYKGLVTSLKFTKRSVNEINNAILRKYLKDLMTGLLEVYSDQLITVFKNNEKLIPQS